MTSGMQGYHSIPRRLTGDEGFLVFDVNMVGGGAELASSWAKLMEHRGSFLNQAILPMLAAR